MSSIAPGLEVLEDARAAGRHRVIEQTIAPRRVEQDLLRAEQQRFPDWQTPVEDAAVIGDYCSREEAEWRLADRHPLRLVLRPGRNCRMRRAG